MQTHQLTILANYYRPNMTNYFETKFNDLTSVQYIRLDVFSAVGHSISNQQGIVGSSSPTKILVPYITFMTTIFHKNTHESTKSAD